MFTHTFYLEIMFAGSKYYPILKVKSMQRSGTVAIRTKIQQREITKITNSQNTMRTYGQPSEQLHV